MQIKPIGDIVNEIVAAGGQIGLISAGDVRVSGPKAIQPLAAAALGRKGELVDHLTILDLSGGQHAPEAILGRLARNLLPYWRGQKIQSSGKPIHGFKGMIQQIFAAIKAAPPGDPEGELKAMIMAFKALVGTREWTDTRIVDDWPQEQCPAFTKDSKLNPNRDIPEKPPPGLVFDDQWIRKREIEEAARAAAIDDDIPF